MKHCWCSSARRGGGGERGSLGHSVEGGQLECEAVTTTYGMMELKCSVMLVVKTCGETGVVLKVDDGGEEVREGEEVRAVRSGGL